MNADEVLAINGWSSTFSYDEDTMNELIALYKGIAEEYCNDIFDVEPASVKKFIAYCIKQNDTEMLAGKTMGSVSYQFVTDLPNHLYSYLNPFRKIRW